MFLLFFLFIFYFILIFILFCFKSDFNSRDLSVDEQEFLCCFSFAYFVIAFLVYFCVCGIIQSVLPTSMQMTQKVEIYSLNDNLCYDGHFSFGCGYIDTDLFYFYYTDGDFGYKIEKINSNNVEIVELKNENDIPCLVTYEKLLNKPNYWFAFGKNVFEIAKKKVLYVPKGSIQIYYSIDLE